MVGVAEIDVGSDDSLLGGSSLVPIDGFLKGFSPESVGDVGLDGVLLGAVETDDSIGGLGDSIDESSLGLHDNDGTVDDSTPFGATDGFCDGALLLGPKEINGDSIPSSVLGLIDTKGAFEGSLPGSSETEIGASLALHEMEGALDHESSLMATDDGCCDGERPVGSTEIDGDSDSSMIGNLLSSFDGFSLDSRNDDLLDGRLLGSPDENESVEGSLLDTPNTDVGSSPGFNRTEGSEEGTPLGSAVNVCP